MNMFADITKEQTILAIVEEIKEVMDEQIPPYDIESRQALRKIGRFALSMLEWKPAWVEEYKCVFGEG